MNWHNNLKVRTKLIGGFLVISLIAALIGIIAIVKAHKINDMATQMYEKELIGLSYSSSVNIEILAVARALRTAILSYTQQDRNAQIAEMRSRLAKAKDALTNASKKFTTPQGKELIRQATELLAKYEVEVNTVINFLQNEPLNEKRESTDHMLYVVFPLGVKVDDAMAQLVERKKHTADSLSNETDVIFANIRILLISLTIGGLILGLVIGIAISKNLTRQLGGEPQDVADVANAIAAGNLTTYIDASNAQDGSIVQAMYKMQTSLKNMVQTVRSSSDSIATGSRQITTGNLDLSVRTEQQASSLEETASSMEELTSTVKQNADNARQANQMAVAASGAALKGGEVVSQVVQTMGTIDDSSRKIVDIISVIDGIAFQTNILALNAAVEAARAGEQGRGFAVVASEVRNLAQRSASAAKEIKVLIEDSVDKVAAGIKLADQAGSTMTEIMENSHKVRDVIAEITSASQEQTSGIEQINQAIIQMDNVTQQNASLVEEAAAASQFLQDQADALSKIVAVFQLGDAVRIHQQQPPALKEIAHVSTAQKTRPSLPKRKPSLLENQVRLHEEEWERF